MKHFGINLGMYSVDESCSTLKYKPVIIDRIMEALAILSFVAGWSITLFIYINNGGVTVEIYGGLVVSLLVFLLLFTSAYTSAEKIRYPVKINKNNIVRQYVFALRLIRFMNIFISLFFSIGLMSRIYPRIMVLNFVFLNIIFIGVVIYYILAIKNR